MASKSSMRDVEQRLGPVGAGVVDEDVEGLGAGDRGLHGGKIGDVEDQRLGLLTARPDRLRGRLDLALRARGERHMRAGVGQRPGGGQPDAAPGAGHQRALAVEAEGGGSSKFHYSAETGCSSKMRPCLLAVATSPLAESLADRIKLIGVSSDK